MRDPQAASRALARVGFTPAPLSVQVNPDPAGGPPQLTGTGNVTAMFSRGYIEVLFKTADTPLGRELDAGLARYPGIHLAAFAVADAADAHGRLAASGFRVRPLTRMQRPVDTGGEPGTAAFTLARVEAGEMPEGRIQILTHHTEDMVWQPRWLTHANGALGLASLTIAVADVDEAAARFARFTGRAGDAVRRRTDDRARPRPARSRHRRRVLAALSRMSDPVAAVRRRLRNNGQVAGSLGSHLDRRGSAGPPGGSRADRATSRTNWDKGSGGSRNEQPSPDIVPAPEGRPAL